MNKRWNVFVTRMLPHIGSATIEARINMGMIAARNIIAAMNGKVPKTLVNTDVLKK
ncbi:MAG TPA: hypothetical protein PKU88_07665 [Bacillota bacterium]|nr:hypothetical protein [Bacillota bacterium]HPX69190.1 hypothetical protein [Bacillota bacterium]HQA65347.1 hypothetical protein [Bacillota bacterium]HQO43511.1 hypothetical protein [Bacillota bacterium]HQQ45529.1 hypothetical protein [Bacillota bacterium]